MYDEYYTGKSPRKWTFEEIDELLQDSGMTSEKEFQPEPIAKTINKPEAIDPRPTYNEEIEHKIKTTKVEKSSVDGATRAFTALESDKYRDRFLNKPMHNLEKTAEHKFIPAGEQPYERGGFVKKASNFKSTRELEPVPLLVSEDLLREEQKKEESTKEIRNEKTIGLRSLAVTDGSSPETELIEEEDMQLSFEGFNTSEIETVDEEEIERELIKKRRKKAAEFVVSTEPEDTFEETPNSKFGLDEYRSVNDKFKVQFYLKKQEKSATFATLVSFICLAVLIALSVIASVVYAPNSLVHKNEFPVILLNLAVTLTACMVSKDVFFDGLQSIKGFKFNRNSGCTIALLVTVIQNIFFFFAPLPFENRLSLYSAVAVFSLVLNNFACVLEAKRMKKNFNIVSEKELHSISHIERKEMQYLYSDGELFHFMDVETYDQIALNEEAIGDALKFVKENEMVKICSYKGNVFAVEPPMFVVLEITDTEPGFKGDTAQGATKPAVVETGATVYVPLFVEQNDMIKIDTRTGEYLSRE